MPNPKGGGLYPTLGCIYPSKRHKLDYRSSEIHIRKGPGRRCLRSERGRSTTDRDTSPPAVVESEFFLFLEKRVIRIGRLKAFTPDLLVRKHWEIDISSEQALS